MKKLEDFKNADLIKKDLHAIMDNAEIVTFAQNKFNEHNGS